MTATMDRNLLVGTLVALTLAALLALAVRSLPVHVFRLPVPVAAPRASSAWAEPRDIDWRPRAAPAAAAPVPAAVAQALEAPGKSRARAPAPAGLTVPAGARGAVAVPVAAAGEAVAAPAAVAAGAGGAPAAAVAGPAATGAADAVYGPGDVDVPPAPLAFAQPRFPAAAEQLGLAADVLVSFVVDIDGHVSQIDARCAACDASFLRAARAAARTWRFTPARLHGQPVRVRVEQPLHFELDE